MSDNEGDNSGPPIPPPKFTNDDPQAQIAHAPGHKLKVKRHRHRSPEPNFSGSGKAAVGAAMDQLDEINAGAGIDFDQMLKKKKKKKKTKTKRTTDITDDTALSPVFDMESNNSRRSTNATGTTMETALTADTEFTPGIDGRRGFKASDMEAEFLQNEIKNEKRKKKHKKKGKSMIDDDYEEEDDGVERVVPTGPPPRDSWYDRVSRNFIKFPNIHYLHRQSQRYGDMYPSLGKLEDQLDAKINKDENKKKKRLDYEGRFKRRSVCILIILVALLVIGGIAGGVGYYTKTEQSRAAVSFTRSPTTMTPTESPTKFPTMFPTMSPTKSPTRFPTESPTPNPTKFPTLQPTQNPTMFPTKTGQTRFPTVMPTGFPTAKPTTFPTKFPSQ